VAGERKIPKSKACKILHDGKANGKSLTPRQRRYMGWRCNASSRAFRVLAALLNNPGG
jgi:hypothetical protein